jgi:intraflagellar transport protein 172
MFLSRLKGNLTGAVELFDCALRRSRLKGKFDVVYVGPSQVMVTSLSTGAQCAVKSAYGMEIEKVRRLVLAWMQCATLS